MCIFLLYTHRWYDKESLNSATSRTTRTGLKTDKQNDVKCHCSANRRITITTMRTQTTRTESAVINVRVRPNHLSQTSLSRTRTAYSLYYSWLMWCRDLWAIFRVSFKYGPEIQHIDLHIHNPRKWTCILFLGITIHTCWQCWCQIL